MVSVALAAFGWGVWSLVAGTYASYVAWVVTLWMYLLAARPGKVPLQDLAFAGQVRLPPRAVDDRIPDPHGHRVAGGGPVPQHRCPGLLPLRAADRAHSPDGIIEVGATTLFPAFARIADQKDHFAAAYLRALHWSMVGAAAGTGIMLAVGEPAVVVLFGAKWRGAGVALVAMSGLNIGSAVSVVVQDAIKAQGRTRLINWFTLGDFVLGVGFLVTLIGPVGFVGASLYISLTSLGCAVIMLILAQKVMTVPFRKVLWVQTTPLPAMIVATAVTFLLEHYVLRSDTRG